MTDNTETLPTTTSGNLPASAARMAKLSKSKHHDKFEAGDLMLPWFQIVQTSSGYMKKNNAEYIKDASEGDLIDTLSKRLRSSQTIILVKFETHYTTFKPGGGKLVKQWFTDPTGYNAASFPPGKDYGKKIDGEGNEVQKVPMYYVLMVDMEKGTAIPASMAWGSTQAKKVKRVNTLARADLTDPESGLPFTPPIYARLFDITTRIETGGESGDKSWGGWVATVGDLVLDNEKFGEMWHAAAEAFREQIDLGNVRPLPPENSEAAEDDDRPQRRNEESYEGGVRRGGDTRTLDDDLPF